MPGLLARTPAVTSLADGLRLQFDRGQDVLRDITDVIERERQCCRFLKFVLTVPPGDGQFQLDITGPEGTTDFLAEVSKVSALSASASAQRLEQVAQLDEESILRAPQPPERERIRLGHRISVACEEHRTR